MSTVPGRRRQAVDLIDVKYEKLPFIIDPLKSMEQDDIRILGLPGLYHPLPNELTS